jgi:hypothetical protein
MGNRIKKGWKIGSLVLIVFLMFALFRFFRGGNRGSEVIEADSQRAVNMSGTGLEVIDKDKLVVDRFEGDFGICIGEDNKSIKLSRSLMPRGTLEGDVLIANGRGYRIDFEDRKKRKAEIDELVKELWE